MAVKPLLPPLDPSAANLIYHFALKYIYMVLPLAEAIIEGVEACGHAPSGRTLLPDKSGVPKRSRQQRPIYRGFRRSAAWPVQPYGFGIHPSSTTPSQSSSMALPQISLLAGPGVQTWACPFMQAWTVLWQAPVPHVMVPRFSSV